MTGVVHGEKRTGKQIGCMSGFLHIFDRQQLLAGKRIHSTKRLPPASAVSASPDTELGKPETQKHVVVAPCISQSSPASVRPKSPALGGMHVHRHSLDSRATVVDNQRRSPSVIARLMGLEPLPSSDPNTTQNDAKPALRRCASEPRVSRDIVDSKFIDDNNFQVKQPNKSPKQQSVDASNIYSVIDRSSKSMEASRTSPWRSRSFFDSTDFFPEHNQTTVTMHGGFEKKLKMRGMDEQSNDLSTLKQILEVLQLKGLLHSSSRSNRGSYRNFVHDRNLHSDESSIVVVKPWRSSASKVDYQRSINDSRRTSPSPAVSPKRDGGAVDRSGRSPVRGRASASTNRIESNLKACNSISKRRDNESSGSLKRSPINSPKHTPKRNGSVHHSVINRSPRNLKSTESCIASTPSTTNSERCDKLVRSVVVEMNSTTESPSSSALVLPSPVSVLDSGFDQDEPCSPSHTIDFKATPAVTSEDENRSPKQTTEHEEFTSDDPAFIYISEIVRASQHLHEDSNVFFSIETKLYNTDNTSNVSKRQRKLIFDVVLEIINKNRQVPPWKTSIEDSRALVKQIWSEFQKIRETNSGDGVLELVSGVVKKDLVEINNGWRDYPMETSEAILDIERMIFKDLVSEAILDMAEFSGEYMFFRTRRKLIF